MMPHPERVLYRYTHTDWTRTGATGGEGKDTERARGDGWNIFSSAVEYAAGR